MPAWNPSRRLLRTRSTSQEAPQKHLLLQPIAEQHQSSLPGCSTPRSEHMACGGVARPRLRLRRAPRRRTFGGDGVSTSFSNAAVATARAISLLERATIERHTKHNLARMHSVLDIVSDSKVDTERRALRSLLRRVDVRLMSSLGIPRSGKVVCHHVPEVQILVHLAQL